ncbi:MAG: alpha/beta fold hydrolase, partial [Alphaproteobacteria bacterium]|nr:alpha/beta fold hydrolase [Alphaproteobacteria bacterium]
MDARQEPGGGGGGARPPHRTPTRALARRSHRAARPARSGAGLPASEGLPGRLPLRNPAGKGRTSGECGAGAGRGARAVNAPRPRRAGTDADDALGTVRASVVLDSPLALECGRTLRGAEIAYESYGRLDARRANAVLVLHGLTADRHAAGGLLASTGRPGWWDAVIGPGKAIDTDRWFVLAPAALGGADGTTGPASVDPETGRPWAMRFPVVTVADMANANAALADALGIRRFAAVVGGCMGGFQVLEWMARHPERLERAIAIGATARTSAHNLGLWSVMRQAIRTDPRWNGGDYYGAAAPDAGVALLAMFGA